MANLNFSLLKWQKEVLSDPTRFKVVVAGRRCGKSRLAAVKLLIYGLKCPQGSAVMYVAPTQGQARVIIWDILMELGREVISASHVNNMEITLANGAKIYIRGADRPDTLRGVSLTFVVLDEYADMKPIVWEQIIRAALSDKKGDALFIGTPKGRNHFYDVYLLGQDEDETDYKSWQLTTADNELIDEKEIEAAKKTLSSFSFKQEYLASFDNAGTDMFKEQWLRYGKEPKDGSWFIACDLAGFEEVSKAGNSKSRLDQSAFAIVKVTDEGKWFVKTIEHGRWDIRETAVRILKNIREYRPMMIGIERGTTMNAVMPYLSDLMRKNNVFAHIHPLSHQNQKKTERIVWALQGMFEHGRIILNSEDKDVKNSWQWVFTDQYMMFPTKNVHDDCFPAEAPIITLNGVKPICEITTDDFVLTSTGEYKKVIRAWCKGNKSVITRYGITATPEHNVYTTNKGWVQLNSLCDDDTILVSESIKDSSCEKLLYSMGVNTTDTLMRSNQTTKGIIQATKNGKIVQECCIETFGSSLMGTSQVVITSIIPMEILITTKYQTCAAYQVQPIKSSIGKNGVIEQELRNISSIWKISEVLLSNGIRQKKVGNGIGNTQKNHLCKNVMKSHAENVENNLSQKCQSKSCVVENAQTIDRLELLEKNVPVYDLTVEGNPEFFAYGVLVHNCMDALAYIGQMAVTTYGEPDEEEFEAIEVMTGY